MTYKNLNAVILEVYKPKSPDEQKFVDKHVTIKHKDRNGNGDDVFNGNTKYIKRKGERHGYDVGEDEKVYESIEELDEDSDQIHELSRDTLVNYIGKASDARGHRNLPTKKVDNRYKGVATAGKKFDAKEEVEDIDDLLDEALDLLNSIDEKTLTPAELKKREEIVKAVKRGDPKMDKSVAYAIATKTAKRVAEETDEARNARRGAFRTSLAKAISKGQGNKFLSDKNKGKTDKRVAESDLPGAYSDKVTMPQSKWSREHGATARSRYMRLSGKGKGLGPLPEKPMTKEEVENIDENYERLQHLGRMMSRLQKQSDAIKGIHPDKKRMAIQIAAMKKEHDTLFRRQFGEEVELDELSRDTVKRYKDTATKNLDYHAAAWDNIAQADANAKGFTKAQGASFKKHDSEAGKRYFGIKLANNKLAKEGFPLGKVDEANTGDEAEKKFNKYNAKELDYMLDRAAYKSKPGDAHKQNRARQAKDAAYNIMMRKKYLKLTKEDIIDSAYERYVPEEVKFTPQELFVNRLESLSESHADILMDLFESLSKENQIKMTQDAKTTEGLNKLLNFAIENRENV